MTQVAADRQFKLFAYCHVLTPVSLMAMKTRIFWMIGLHISIKLHVKYVFGPGRRRWPVEDTLFRFSSRVSTEWSGGGNGRIDFWIPDAKWGIELLRDGDRLDEHL